MNQYIVLALAFFAAFIILSLSVSPHLDTGILPIVQIDKNIFRTLSEYIPSQDTPLLFHQLILFIIQYGKDYFWAFAGTLLFIFGGWKGRLASSAMLIAFITVALFVTGAKEIIERDRPDIISHEASIILNNRSEYSFPSGHASIVSAGAVCSIVLFRGSAKRNIVSIILACEAIVVCFAQIYVGVHYISDIAGGVAIGSAISFGFLSFSKYGEPILLKVLVFLKLNKTI